MSEQKHTPEPWAAYQDGKIEFGNINHFIKSLAGDLVSYGHLSKDDARRIVACVNWCAGNSTEGMVRAVEIGRPYSVERDSAIERELEVTKQRDELLAGLKAARFHLDGQAHCDATRIIESIENYPHGSLGEAVDSEGGAA